MLISVSIQLQYTNSLKFPARRAIYRAIARMIVLVSVYSETHYMASELAEDLLRGAADIAAFIYGDEKHRAKVYHAVEKDGLPVFRMNGGMLHARKSTILKWIADKEGKAA